MKRRLNFLIALCIILVVNVFTTAAQVRQVKLVQFKLQSSSLIQSTGEEISSPDYLSKVYWFPVKVPSTVLSALVANGIYPDPNYGLNNMLIPDASDEFNKKYNLEQYSFLPNDPNPWKKPYWYRTEFEVPSADKGKCFQLIFKGINYRAGLWVNGNKIADSTVMAGMFAQYSFDVSRFIKPGQKNALAVKIYPLDYPGLPSTEQLEALGDFYPNGGPTGDIGKNVTMLCSVGWDWVPPVRDRNIGLWLPVYLRTSGNITIGNPKITTEFKSEQDTSSAKLSLSFDLFNHSSKNETGKLTVSIFPENFTGQPVQFIKTQAARQGITTQVDFNPSNTKELLFNAPAIWWPNGYGKPNLYRIRLQFSTASGISDDTTFVFGIRTASSKAVNVNGSWRRDFYMNGRRLHLTGGAWVPDFMLNRDSLRYDYEMRLCRNANINLVRIWGGGVTPCDEFFDAADRYGLMVWSDFWITGDTQGEFKGSPDWPLEGEVFKRNVVSTVLRIRNHPSLLVWTGGNEGHARKDLYDFMRNSAIELDGTRPFIPCSSGFANLPQDWPASWPDNLPGGVYSGGPYTWQDPKTYYSRAIAGKDWVFKDETGIPSMPPYNIMPRIVTDLVWDKKLPFPLNNSWGYHDACSGNGHWEFYYKEMVKRYGEPVTMENFCDKMQLMNAAGYQGIFEAAGHKLNDIGGVMLWKINAAFPSVVWQIYDWFLMPNAGYYFTQNACEPVHIQLNLVTNKITVLNRTYKVAPNLAAVVDIYSTDSKLLYHDQSNVSLGPTDVKETADIADALAKTEGVKFVKLSLKSSAGKILSRNIYWLSSNANFKAMNDMAKATLSATLTKASADKNNRKWTLRVTNNSDKLAFFIRPQLMSKGDEVLPSLWSAGYFSLAPGESSVAIVTCPAAALKGGEPVVKVSGWNVEATEVRENIINQVKK